jgi:formyl-CoA transferase
MQDPQLTHRRSFGTVHDAGGTFAALNPPFRYSAAEVSVGERSPALGEHTHAVLREAGYTPAEIDALSK